MSVRTVTADDLEPAGWVCEGAGCGHDFAVGEQITGEVIGSNNEGGDVVGGWRCQTCADGAVPVAGPSPALQYVERPLDSGGSS